MQLAGVKGQILPDQPDLPTSPDVQEADKHVAGTVSVDEQTLQPDLNYDSELSDDDTASDSSTLPSVTPPSK